MTLPILAVTGVDKTFTMHLQGGQRLVVLRGLTFEVRAGECVALGGASGTGKSSILKMVYGNYAADRGSIVLRPPGDHPPASQRARPCPRTEERGSEATERRGRGQGAQAPGGERDNTVSQRARPCPRTEERGSEATERRGRGQGLRAPGGERDNTVSQRARPCPCTQERGGFGRATRERAGGSSAR